MKIPLSFVRDPRMQARVDLMPRCETVRHFAAQSKWAAYTMRLCSICLRSRRRCIESRHQDTRSWKAHRATQHR